MQKKSTHYLLSPLLVILLLTMTLCSVNAQTPGTVSVKASESKTNIWVSNFPKNTSVLIIDADYNLISMVTTNDFGATFISLDKPLKTSITVKTINGDIKESNNTLIIASQLTETTHLKIIKA